ncbi:hypothetical protein BaRGS_00025448, partial [Batillaria attramentaria]
MTLTVTMSIFSMWRQLTEAGQAEDEREDIQKKTFTKWINSQLSKAGRQEIHDLFVDLRDGASLLSLLEVLSGLVLKREKGRLRVHHINNVNRALEVLETNYNIKLVNISSNDIVDGNPKLTLGLVWSIILHWQVKDVMKNVMEDLRQTNLERTLLAWCQMSTAGYKGVNITNFTTSWRDGLAFNALLHHFRPDLFRYEDLLHNDSETNLNHAFQAAFEHLGIARLLDAEDMSVDVPDKKSIMTYLMCMFQVLPHATLTSQITVEPHPTGRTAPSPALSPASPSSPENSVSSSSELALPHVPREKMAEVVTVITWPLYRQGLLLLFTHNWPDKVECFIRRQSTVSLSARKQAVDITSARCEQVVAT